MTADNLRTAFESWALNTPADERTNWEVFQAGARAAAQCAAEGDEWTGKCVLGHCGSPSGCEDSGYCRADPPKVQPKGKAALHPVARRRVLDAIRGAYDLGYNDARNARTVPGDSAPGYKGRDVETDHGGALIHALEALQAPAPAPEPSTREHHIALREAHQIVDSDCYFNARPALDNPAARDRFEAGYKRGFDAADKLASQAPAVGAEEVATVAKEARSFLRETRKIIKANNALRTQANMRAWMDRESELSARIDAVLSKPPVQGSQQ